MKDKLEKQTSYSHLITESGHIQICKITRIMENDKELGKSYHRYVLSPGDDYTNEDERTRVIARVIHTPEVIAAYEEMVKEV